MFLCEEHSFQLLPILGFQSKEAAEEQAFTFLQKLFMEAATVFIFKTRRKKKRTCLISFLQSCVYFHMRTSQSRKSCEYITIFMVYSHIAQQTVIKMIHAVRQNKTKNIIVIVLNNNGGKSTRNRFPFFLSLQTQVKLCQCT